MLPGAPWVPRALQTLGVSVYFRKVVAGKTPHVGLGERRGSCEGYEKGTAGHPKACAAWREDSRVYCRHGLWEPSRYWGGGQRLGRPWTLSVWCMPTGTIDIKRLPREKLVSGRVMQRIGELGGLPPGMGEDLH